MADALPLTFHYQFTFKDGSVKEFELSLDGETLQLLAAPQPPYPSWTALSYHQCPNCPLNEKDFPQCPPAAYLTDFIAFAEKLDSFEEADIQITVSARTYRKHTAVQFGLSSLMGIYMTTSGCPILDKLRPMVKTHLPFAKSDETTYRMISMYLLAQFLRMIEKKHPDWELQGLAKIIREINTVNQNFWKRISVTNLQLKDGGVNALHHLDTIAKLTTYQLQDPEFSHLKTLFQTYLKENH